MTTIRSAERQGRTGPSPRLCIINYGMGNLNSVRNAVTFLGYEVSITGDVDQIACADAYILPGVGAFGQAMENLHASGLVAALTREVLEGGKPLLGICLGLQLLATSSEELGHHAGLGWIDAHVHALNNDKIERVPHVGWSEVDVVQDHRLFANAQPQDCYYFDHSFHFDCADESVLARCNLGMDIVAAVQRDNIMAVQFHPEKSHRAGLKLLRNFLDICDSRDGARETLMRAEAEG